VDDASTEEGSRRGRRASEGTEHLQAAARELIAAARSFLDVAEDAIEDSEVVDEVGALLRDLGRRAASAASPGSDGSDSPGSTRAGSDVGSDGGSGDRTGSSGQRRSRVRRIDVE
jgi:hypothetical protein